MIQIQRKNKRGISPVIATILLILITVAAVSILAAFIYPMVKNNTQTATVCFDAQQQVQIETENGKTCFNESVSLPDGTLVSDAKVSLQIKKNPGTNADISDIQVIFTDSSGDTSSQKITEVSGMVPGDNEAKTYEFTTAGKTIAKVAIAPIVKAGNTQTPCSASTPIDLPVCS
jgi:flagellin-like protein